MDGANVAGMRAARDNPNLDQEAAEKLCLQAQAGDREAQDTLVLSVLRLLVRLADSFVRRYPHMDRDDLYQLGVVVTITYGVRRYDASHGVPFQKWVALCVRRQFTRQAARNAGILHAPVSDLMRKESMRGGTSEKGRQLEEALISAPRRELEEALESLPISIDPHSQKALAMHLAGHTYAEIAEALGFGRQGRNRVMRLLRTLKEEHAAS